MAEDAAHGVAVLEAASGQDCPPCKRGLLLHGIYVHPGHQGEGIGKALLQTALQAAKAQGVDGLLVKAQADAEGFSQAQGMERLPVEDPGRDYANRFWKSVV